MLQTIQDNQLIMQQSSAELDVQISTAKRFPRSIEKAKEDAKKSVTLSDDIAGSCTYTVPRAGKNITGPSIRLAEIMCQHWGNIHAASRTIGNDVSFVITQAVAWDLESNVRVIVENKRKVYGNTDDSKALAANASASIALRNAIFKVIPRAIVDEVYNHAMKYLSSPKQNENPVDRCLAKFKELGHTEGAVLRFLNRLKKEEVTENDLIVMRGIFTRIKEGEIDPKDALKIEKEDEETNNEKLDDL